MIKYTQEQLENMTLEELKKLPPRNLHLMAIAPNANSSIILGCSSSIEPRLSNCYTHKTRVGSYLVKNPALVKYLNVYEMNTDEVWKSIMNNNGSVQHLDFLDDDTKKVFRTAQEMDQRWLVLQARARQPFVCQGQSVNLFFETGADKAYVNAVHRLAFTRDEIGDPLKGLYYLRTESVGKVEKVNVEVKRDKLQDGVQGELEECIACHS